MRDVRAFDPLLARLVRKGTGLGRCYLVHHVGLCSSSKKSEDLIPTCIE